MDKWYKDQNLLQISMECDQAHDGKNIDRILLLIEKTFEEGHCLKNSNLVRAKHLYNCYTMLISYIEFSASENNDSRISMIKNYEAEYEKCFYLARTAFDIIQLESKKNKQLSKVDKAYFDGFYLQMKVNYSNLLHQNGRIIKSLECLELFSEIDFPMGVGGLGMKISDYADFYYDEAHNNVLYYTAYSYLNKAIHSRKDYPEKKFLFPVLLEYQKKIGNNIEEKYLKSFFKLTDFIEPFDKISRDEKDYREWFSKNGLGLIVLNDVYKESTIAYDPLHLPDMREKIDSKKIISLYGLFNQIKQEYVSSRFFAFEGLNNKETHFSDKDVYLVNTLDYPVYGIGIEKIKSAYRGIYSVFDKISYFLNEYFELGIKKKEISYHRIWQPNSHDNKKLIEFVSENYPLLGMWWLYKDIRNRHLLNSEKYIDPVMSKISKVRNAMEHTYLKITDNLDENREDKMAYNINVVEFEKLTLSLFKYAREAIILLVLIVRQEECRRNIENPVRGKYAETLMTEYEDSWKQIF